MLRVLIVCMLALSALALGSNVVGHAAASIEGGSACLDEGGCCEGDEATPVATTHAIPMTEAGDVLFLEQFAITSHVDDELLRPPTG